MRNTIKWEILEKKIPEVLKGNDWDEYMSALIEFTNEYRRMEKELETKDGLISDVMDDLDGIIERLENE